MSDPELRLLSHDFRDLASRVANSHYDHTRANLRHLLDFVAETPLLRKAVESAQRPAVSVEEAVERCKGRRHRLEPPENRHEELGFLHDVLTYLVELDERDFQQIVLVYGFHRRFQDNVAEFVHDTVVPYSAHLRRVITAALLQVEGGSTGSQVEVNTSTGGSSQIVVHQGVGDVHSVQVARQEAAEVVEAARALQAVLESPASELPVEVVDELKEIAAESSREAGRSQPSKWGLKAMHGRLVVLAETVEAGNKVFGPIVRLTRSIAALLGFGGL